MELQGALPGVSKDCLLEVRAPYKATKQPEEAQKIFVFWDHLLDALALYPPPRIQPMIMVLSQMLARPSGCQRCFGSFKV